MAECKVNHFNTLRALIGIEVMRSLSLSLSLSVCVCL